MKKIKCNSCGSTQVLKTEEDVRTCQYCGAKFDISNTVKDVFLDDLSKLREGEMLKFVSAKVTQNQFYKNAIMHLSMNKNSPKDILNSQFSYVKYRYVFFAVFDIDYYFENIYMNGSKKSNYISPIKESSKITGKTMCVKITQDCSKEQAKLILDNFAEYCEKGKINPASTKDAKIKYPTKQEIKDVIKNAISDYENKEVNTFSTNLLFKKSENTRIVHTINNMEILAIPEYYLEFTYQNKNFRLSSFADKLNVFGEIPKVNDFKKEKEKKLLFLPIINFSIAFLILLFGYYNLLAYRTVKLVPFEYVNAVLAAILVVANFLVENVVTKSLNNKYFEEKKNNYLTFIKNKKIKLSQSEKENLDFMKGGY